LLCGRPAAFPAPGVDPTPVVSKAAVGAVSDTMRYLYPQKWENGKIGNCASIPLFRKNWECAAFPLARDRKVGTAGGGRGSVGWGCSHSWSLLPLPNQEWEESGAARFKAAGLSLPTSHFYNITPPLSLIEAPPLPRLRREHHHPLLRSAPRSPASRGSPTHDWA
jgi:hypothetical protein